MGTAIQSLMTEGETAEYLSISIAALRKWRMQGRGPVFIKLGNLVRYRREDVEAWLASCPKGGASFNNEELGGSR